MHLRRALAVGVASMTLAVGCSLPGGAEPPGGVACTMIGCESAVAFQLSADLENGVRYRVQACLEGLCEAETVEVPVGGAEGGAVARRVGSIDLGTETNRILLILPEGEFGGARRVSLRVVDERGDVLVDAEAVAELERQQPNGPNCPPVCWFAELDL